MSSSLGPNSVASKSTGIVLTIVLVIIGFLIGAAADDFGIAVTGALFGLLLGGHFRLRKRLQALESKIDQLATADISDEPAATPEPEPSAVDAPQQAEIDFPAPSRASQPSTESAQETKEVSSEEPELVFDIVLPGDQPEPAAPAPAPAPAPAKPSLIDRIAKAVIAYFTGGNLMVRIGVVVLFFGVAFLLRYAAERAWIPIELRLSAVALGGMAMLGLGWRLRHRAGYGLALQGGGIGIIYLTVFAAFRLYNLLPPTLAFIILVLCVLLSSAIAVLQNSRALATLSVAGGFLAPVLASTGQGSHVALFAYYLLLNAGILGISWFKAWRILNLVGFIFTFGIASLWGYRYYQPQYFSTTEPFLVLFFLFYVLIAILFASRQPPRLKGYVDGTLVFGTPLIGFALQAALVADFTYGLAISAVVLGGFYLVAAWLLVHRSTPGMRILAEAFIAIGVVFVSLAIPLGLDARWTTAMWALEGTALIWIGVRQTRLGARLFGLLLTVGAGLFHIAEWPGSYESTAFLNSWYLGTVILALAGLYSAYYLWRHLESIRSWERFIVPALFAWGLAWWLLGGLTEITLHLDWSYQYGALLLLFAITAALAGYGQVRLSWPLLRYPALALLPVLILVLLSTVFAGDHPFARWGFLGWPLALAVHYRILYRFDQAQLNHYLSFLHTGAFWLVLILITWELSWGVGRITPESGAWKLAVLGIVPALALFAMQRWGQHLSWPIARHIALYMTLGCWPVIGYLWLWFIGANLSGPADPSPLPYLPILNPIDIAFGFALLVMFGWQYAVDYTEDQLRIYRYILAGSLFFWINAILIRTMHHWAGISFSAQAMLGSFLVQAGITILWSLTGVALMIAGTKRQIRLLWMLGAGLMGVVVAKLFLIDLAGSGTVERIVAFLVVGLLLLLVGYFAPAPPKMTEQE